MRKNQTVYTDCRDNQHNHISMGFVNGNSPNDLSVMEVEPDLWPQQVIVQTLLHQLQDITGCPPVHWNNK